MTVRRRAWTLLGTVVLAVQERWRASGHGPRMLAGSAWFAAWCAMVLVVDREAAGLMVFLASPGMVVAVVQAGLVLRDRAGAGALVLGGFVLGTVALTTGPLAVADTALAVAGHEISCPVVDGRVLDDPERPGTYWASTARCPGGDVTVGVPPGGSAAVVVTAVGVPRAVAVARLTPPLFRVVGGVALTGWVAFVAWTWTVWRRSRPDRVLRSTTADP